jgi:hypothetical protein
MSGDCRDELLDCESIGLNKGGRKRNPLCRAKIAKYRKTRAVVTPVLPVVGGEPSYLQSKFFGSQRVERQRHQHRTRGGATCSSAARESRPRRCTDPRGENGPLFRGRRRGYQVTHFRGSIVFCGAPIRS